MLNMLMWFHMFPVVCIFSNIKTRLVSPFSSRRWWSVRDGTLDHWNRGRQLPVTKPLRETPFTKVFFHVYPFFMIKMM
jgi:hypothetical protein